MTTESGVTRYLEEIRRPPMLEPHEEYMLAKRWREYGDHEAAHKLANSHLRLVARIARDHRGYGLPISELISEGNVGLMQAIKGGNGGPRRNRRPRATRFSARRAAVWRGGGG